MENKASGLITPADRLVFNLLYSEGYEKIFCTALNNGECKDINAVIIGLGEIGRVMARSLVWFCQMDGYRFNMDCFDKKENARKEFCELCPELMDKRHNGSFDIEGEARYKIAIHSGVDVTEKDFFDLYLSTKNPTLIFVALGDDLKTANTAASLYKNLKDRSINAVIYAVIENADKIDVNNFEGNVCYIDKRRYIVFDGVYPVDDTCCDTLTELEKEAIKRHLKNGKPEAFFKSSFHYRSSLAAVIHHKMKKLCKIKGCEKVNPKDRTKEELLAIRILEHRRWNAYMRSEGYRYAGTINPEAKNHQRKLHNCLVPFDMLPLSEQEKDDY